MKENKRLEKDIEILTLTRVRLMIEDGREGANKPIVCGPKWEKMRVANCINSLLSFIFSFY